MDEAKPLSLSPGTTIRDESAPDRARSRLQLRPIGAPDGPGLGYLPPSRRKPRTLDPRVIGPIAFIIAVIAIALELAYTIFHFVEGTFHQLG